MPVRRNLLKLRYFSAYSGLPRAVYWLFTARLVSCLGSFILPLLTLILTQKLQMDKAAAGQMLSLLILTQAPCLMLGGRLVDTVGRKKLFAGGYLAGAFFYALCACGLAGRAMLACILLAADMLALAAPAADAMVADCTPAAQRQEAFSLLYLGANIGMAVSPLVGGLLFASHLQLLFALDAATSAAGVALVCLCVPDCYRPAAKTAGAGTGGTAEAPAAAAGPAAAGTLTAALRAAPVLIFYAALLFVYEFCYTQWSFLLPAQFGDRFGAGGARLYSVLCSVNAVTVTVMTPLLTLTTRRLRPLAAAAFSGLLYAAAFLGFAAGGPYPVFAALAVVFTLGEICQAIRSAAFLSNHVPAACQGRITAFANFVCGAARAAGPLVMGRVLVAAGYRFSWLLTAGIVLAGAAGMLALDRRWR